MGRYRPAEDVSTYEGCERRCQAIAAKLALASRGPLGASEPANHWRVSLRLASVCASATRLATPREEEERERTKRATRACPRVRRRRELHPPPPSAADGQTDAFTVRLRGRDLRAE